jgi:hypothetical protein
MKTNKKIIETVMNKNIKVISIDSKKKEFTTDDGNTYPILFDIDEDITIDEFQIALDESKEIMIKLLEGNE